MMRPSSVALVALLLLCAGARAQTNGIFVPLPNKMDDSVALKADNLNFTLIPSGRSNSILVWGEINKGDALRFSTAITAAKPINEILFYSPGGNLYEGLKIGAMIRRGGFTTRIPEGARCISACNFAFMGGVLRVIDPGATFEVHMFSNQMADRLHDEIVQPPRSVSEFNKRHPNMQLDPDKVDNAVAEIKQKNPQATVPEFLIPLAIEDDVKDIQQDSAQVAADIAQYLVQMRLSLDFLTEFANIPNNKRRALTREELHQFNIINN